MKYPPFPSPSECNEFRWHIEKYMHEYGYRSAALYLLLFMRDCVLSDRCMLEICARLNIGQQNALSLFEPFCIIDDRAHIFLSSIVPQKSILFNLACEIGLLLRVEPTIKDFVNNEYWHQEMLDDTDPSRAFALELCLPSPLMVYFNKSGFDAEGIAEDMNIDMYIVQERLAMPDIANDAILKVAHDYTMRSGRKVDITYDRYIWARKADDVLLGKV